MNRGAKGISVRYLREQCRILEQVVLGQQSATADELAEYRPSRARAGMWNWIRWYAQLVRFNARGEVNPSTADGAEDQLVMDALRNAPVVVRLSVPAPDMPPPVVAVHPKSADALLYLHAKDLILGWLAVRIDALMRRKDPESLDLLERAMVEMGYQQRLVLWCVTTPGQGLPFDPYLDARPEPPEGLVVSPLDFYRVHRAFTTCNVARLHAIKALISPDKTTDEGGSRPSWSAFLGTLADEKGIQPAALMRDYSLGELLAATKLSAGVRREAMEQAKEKAKEDRD